MSITLFEKQSGNLSGIIRFEKDSPLYHVYISYFGQRIYSNAFPTMEKAKRALQRNMKRYA